MSKIDYFSNLRNLVNWIGFIDIHIPNIFSHINTITTYYINYTSILGGVLDVISNIINIIIFYSTNLTTRN